MRDGMQGNGVLTRGSQDETFVSLLHSWRWGFDVRLGWEAMAKWCLSVSNYSILTPSPNLPYYRFTDVTTSRSAAGWAKRRHAMGHFTKYYVSHTSNFFLSLYRYWCFLKVAWIMHIARFNVCQLSRRQKNMQQMPHTRKFNPWSR